MVADEAAFIVLSGGDPQLGWETMRARGLDAALARAAAAGAVILGVSAGAIHMGAYGFQGGADDRSVPPFKTLGLVPYIFGAHDEADDWRHARAALKELPYGTMCIGLPFGSACAIHANGAIDVAFHPLPLLVAPHAEWHAPAPQSPTVLRPGHHASSPLGAIEGR